MGSASEIGIVGYGQTKYEKKTDRTLISMLAETARLALDSAGLKKTDIDGIAVCSFVLPPDNAVTLAEQFGVPISWGYFGTAGGAGPVASVINAKRAIEAGQAKAILCLAGDNYDVAGHYKLMDFFNKALINYGTPNGFGGANGLFGIVQRKHMETYGTRREDLGRIAVGARADLVMVDMTHHLMRPSRDPVRSLVYAAADRAVHTVYIDGKRVVHEGQVHSLDYRKAAEQVDEAQRRAEALVPSRDLVAGRSAEQMSPLSFDIV